MYLYMEFCKHFLPFDIMSEWNYLWTCMIIHLKTNISHPDVWKYGSFVSIEARLWGRQLGFDSQ